MRNAYEDEDNAAMSGELFDRIDQDGHNPTVYGSYAEMRAAEKALPFEDPPGNGCRNCTFFDGDRCSIAWNNNDSSYYMPDRDDKKPTDRCSDWTLDKGAVWEDYFDDMRLP